MVNESINDMIASLDILSSENQFEILMGLARIRDADAIIRAFNKISMNVVVNERAVIEILSSIPNSKDKSRIFQTMLHGDVPYITALFLKALDSEMAKKLEKDVIDALEKGNKDVRIAAIKGLSSIGDDAPVDVFINAIKDEDWEVRSLAVKALGNIITPVASRALYNALFDSEWWVRQNAANALVNHPDYEPLFILAAESNDKYSLDSIISVLENGGDLKLLMSIKRMAEEKVS
jgi:HEAT repeat protein